MFGKLNADNCELFPLVLSSCDKCSDLWQPFFMLLKKYWPQMDERIYLCTETKRCHFDGLDICSPLNMPAGSTWSENLIKLLQYVKEDYLVFMLDDFWLKAPVNIQLLERCQQIMRTNADVGFICLVPQLEPSVENPLSEEFPGLIEYGRQTPYRVTTQAGLWRKDYLQRILLSHESAWWFEMFGSKRSRRMPWRSFVVQTPVFRYDDGGVLYRGCYVSEYAKWFAENEGIELTPGRRMGSKRTLQQEQTEMGLLQKLHPRYVYEYVRSHI